MIILTIVYTILLYLIVFISFFVGIIATILFALFSKNKVRVFQNAATVWGKFIILCSGCRIECSGLENIPKDKGIILACNHQGNVDIPILLASLPIKFHFIIKKELFKIPVFSWYLKKAEYLSVDRGNAASSFSTLKQALTILKKGEAIMIFPEGTRSYDGKLGTFKRGSMMLASASKAPVVPIAIDGSFQVQKRSSLLFYPQKIRLRIGKPMEFGETDDVGKIREAIQTLLSAK